MRSTDIEFAKWKAPPRSHPSLPGQKRLFSIDEHPEADDYMDHYGSSRELFVTGRDLPGAHETVQAILRDI